MSLRGHNLSYRIQASTGSYILRDIHVTMEAGQITLLIGRTGSGKSTLQHLLSGLKIPSDGQVYVGDNPLWKGGKTNGAALHKLGHVHQYPEHQFFLPTVRRELLYSLKPLRLGTSEKKRRIQDAAVITGLGLQMLERSPFHLSGGEKRKAALASVLAVQPDWLLLDEPSSGLDSAFSSWLAVYLKQLKEEKQGVGGIVIATHDLDLFLPIADSVVFLKDGEVLGQWSGAQAARSPDLFQQAEVGVPACVSLAALYCGGTQKGEAFEQAGAGCLNPEEAAARWAHKLRSSQTPAVCESLESSGMPKRSRVNDNAAAEQHSNQIGPDKSFSDPRPNPFAKLDPRSKWAVYLMFSIGVFLHADWVASAVGLGIMFLLSFVACMPLAKWRRVLIPMGWFLLVSFSISGLKLVISFEPFSLLGSSFDWKTAFGSVERLAPLLPVMAGGTLFAYSTSPLSLKKGLEAPLKAIPGFEKGAEAIALATSLMFRFLQLIPAEIERFALLASNRGQKGGKPGKLRIRQLPAFFTPLLLSVLQHAEDLSAAMENRGYGQQGLKRTNADPLRWTPADRAACWVGLCMGGLLALLGRLSG